MLTNVSINSSEILVTKSAIIDQLHSLIQRFKSLANNDNYDHEETNIKFIDTMTNSKHISRLKDIDEIVSNTRKYQHLYCTAYFY